MQTGVKERHANVTFPGSNRAQSIEVVGTPNHPRHRRIEVLVRQGVEEQQKQEQQQQALRSGTGGSEQGRRGRCCDIGHRTVLQRGTSRCGLFLAFRGGRLCSEYVGVALISGCAAHYGYTGAGRWSLSFGAFYFRTLSTCEEILHDPPRRRLASTGRWR